MKEIKAFQCDYCDKYYKHKSSAKKHENRCFKNPKNKACLSCGNFIMDYEIMHISPHGDECGYDYEQKYNYCMSTKKSFIAEKHEERQEFKNNCYKWKSKGEEN